MRENKDYEDAKELGLTGLDRWGTGMDHHPMSERLMAFLEEHDIRDYSDTFCWKTGGDGDNGEDLMYEMDAFFELLDIQVADSSPEKDYADCPEGTYEEYCVHDREDDDG